MESVEGLQRRKPELSIINTQRSDDAAVNTNGTEEDPSLSPAALLFHQPNFNVHVIAIMGCKTRIYADVIKANLVHTMLKHPRFSSLQVVDEKNLKSMKWVRTKVDLEKHVIFPDLDRIKIDSGDKFVEDYIFNLSKASIDKSQPLWDLHFTSSTSKPLNASL